MNENEILKTIGKIADQQKVSVWAVGGFVRDKILNKNVKDIDFAVVGSGTDFARVVAKKLANSSLVIYEKFGTAMVNYMDYKLEFVGTRTEKYADDSRKPIVVESTLDDDLLRRDFTINAIALGINKNNFGEIYDPLNGRDDIKKKIIRTPLDPEITFKDDPLRIMRAIRFATQLQFDISPETYLALKKMCRRLKIISQERITEEIMKILDAEKPSLGFSLLDEAGILELILPEITNMKGVEQRQDYHHKDVFKHTLMVVDNMAEVTEKRELRFAALLHDVGKPATKRFVPNQGWTFHGHDEIGARGIPQICQRLKLPNQFAKYVERLTRLHMRPISLSEESVTDSAMRRLIVQAEEALPDLLLLCRADITSHNPQRVQKHLANFDYVVQRLQEVEEKDQLRAFQSPVRGDEIMKICQLAPGPKVGKIKKMIEEAILDGIIANDHEAAFQYLLKIKDTI